MPIFHAQCTCGALALEVDGDPVHNHVCTCTRCQRASGGALAHNVWFREENVRIVSGEYSVWYPQGETTPDVMKAFCRICGGGRIFQIRNILSRHGRHRRRHIRRSVLSGTRSCSLVGQSPALARPGRTDRASCWKLTSPGIACITPE
ncbi:GFA family protein [Rhizobium brockwellii]|uniref:GFA family protein n=1 Tax=Rhizobium brockwellii TaxID=3019932 RepID=UPI003F9E7C1B